MNRLFVSIAGIFFLMSLTVRGQATMTTLVTNGPTATRLNIVFLSEGYTTNDLSHYISDAKVMLKQMLGTAPLKEYSNYFNAYAISIPSNQSGSDHYTPTTNLVDTYFNSRYDSSGIQRLITIDATGRSRANTLLAQLMPEYDIVALVVNDTQYGGSGGSILISSINVQSPEIATHEMGHTFAQLGDEYSDAGGSPSEKANTTAQTNLALIKWNVWIPGGTPIPTPDISTYYSTVGLFQGAAYSLSYYRPRHDCKMRTLGVAFCEVCGEALVKTIYSKLNMVEAIAPPTNSVLQLTNGMTKTFSVTNLIPMTHLLQIQWFTNNVAAVGATSPVFNLAGFILNSSATNMVRVDVKDATAAVRNDPSNVMKTSITWQANAVIAAPKISITTLAPLSVSWPAIAAGFYLERANVLPPIGSWSPLVLITNSGSMNVPLTTGQGLFRLHKP